MTKKKTAQVDVSNVLAAENFSSNAKTASQPVYQEPIFITLTLDEIQPYPFNPREDRNEAWEEIRESILKRGFEGVLNVTRKPGEKMYWVSGGQNTRLMVLKELWVETKDPQYYHINCRVKPFKSMFDEQVGHILENESRSDLKYLQKAKAYRQARIFMEEELGHKPSLREFKKLMEQTGAKVKNVGHLSRYDYTLDFLNVYIPKALIEGLGQPQVRAIRTLHNIFIEILKESLPDDKFDQAHADADFGRILAKFDGPKWDLAQVEDLATRKLSEITKKERSKIALEFGGKKADKKKKQTNDRPEDEDEPFTVTPQAVGTANSPTAGAQKQEDSSATKPASDVGTANTDIRFLRKAVRDAATELAEHYAMGDLILPTNEGMGFVIDLPDDPLSDFIGSNDDYRVLYGLPKDTPKVWCWWMCASVTEQLSVNRKISQTMPPESRLRQLADQAGPSGDFFPKLQQYVGHADVRELSELWLTDIDDKHYDAVMQLLSAARNLRKVAQQSDLSIWGNTKKRSNQ